MFNHEEETEAVAGIDQILLAAATLICIAATELDWLKTECGTPEQRAEAQKHINDLHDIAELLCPELYKLPASIDHPMPDCGDAITCQPCRNANPVQCGECPGMPAIGSLCHEA